MAYIRFRTSGRSLGSSFGRGLAALVLAGGLAAPACGGSDGDVFDGNGGTGGSVGGGTACTSSAQCPGRTPQCNTATGTCVECLTDANCDADETCDSNFCKETCSATNDCGGDRNCDVPRGVCVECETNADCTEGGEPVCDPRSDSCVECASNNDCGAGSPICVANECEDCARDADCGAGEPFCIQNDCRECRTDGDCGARQACDGDGECQSRCESNADCSGDRGVCMTETGACVECLSDADCTDSGKPGCLLRENKCEECSTNEHCDGDEVCDVEDGKCEGR